MREQEDIQLFHNSLNTYQSPILVDVFDMFIQEVDILFETDHTEILNSGGESKWAGMKRLVFETGISNETLKIKLTELIKDECPSSEGIDWDLDVKFIRGSESDIGLIDLHIRDDRQFITKTKNYFIG